MKHTSELSNNVDAMFSAGKGFDAGYIMRVSSSKKKQKNEMLNDRIKNVRKLAEQIEFAAAVVVVLGEQRQRGVEVVLSLNKAIDQRLKEF